VREKLTEVKNLPEEFRKQLTEIKNLLSHEASHHIFTFFRYLCTVHRVHLIKTQALKSMNNNSTKTLDLRLSALFIQECRKFISALNSDCSMEELAELRQKLIKLRTQQFQADNDTAMVP